MRQTLSAWLHTLFLPKTNDAIIATTGEIFVKESEPEERQPDPEIRSWEKSLAKFNPKTDLLVIPKDNSAFIEKCMDSDILTNAIADAFNTNTLIAIPDLPRPAIVRSGSTSLF